MPAPKKRTFSLPAEQAKYIDSLVASGAYSSASEVVCAGLSALQAHDAPIDRWLREEVAPVYDAMQKDPDRAVSGDELVAAIDARHAERLKSRKRGA